MQRFTSPTQLSAPLEQLSHVEPDSERGKLALVATLFLSPDSEIRIRGAKRLGEIQTEAAVDVGIEALERETSYVAFSATCAALSRLIETFPSRADDIADFSIEKIKKTLSKFEPIEFDAIHRLETFEHSNTSPRSSTGPSRNQQLEELESNIDAFNRRVDAYEKVIHIFYKNVGLESDSDCLVLREMSSLIDSVVRRVRDPVKEEKIVEKIEDAFFFHDESGERHIRSLSAGSFLTSALKSCYSERADELRLTQLKGLHLGMHAYSVFEGFTAHHLHSPSVARIFRDFVNSNENAINSSNHRHETVHLRDLIYSISPISFEEISHEEARDILRGNNPEADPSPLEELLISGTVAIRLEWNDPGIPLEGMSIRGATIHRREGEWLYRDVAEFDGKLAEYANDTGSNGHAHHELSACGTACGAVVRVCKDDVNSLYAQDLLLIVPDGVDARTLINQQPEPTSVTTLDVETVRGLFDSDERQQLEKFLSEGITCLDFAWDRGEADITGYTYNGNVLVQNPTGIIRYSGTQEPIGWAIRYVDSVRRGDPKRVIALFPTSNVDPEYWMKSHGLNMLEVLGDTQA